MFESLGDRLQNAIHKIKGYGKITEDNISDMMREIRLALLEADVNYTVVKEFTTSVKEKAFNEISNIIEGKTVIKLLLNSPVTGFSAVKIYSPGFKLIFKRATP